MTHLGSGPCSLPLYYARKGACSTKIFAKDREGGSGFGAEAEFAAEPRPGVDPQPVGAAGTHPQGRGRLVPRQPREVAQLDELGLERVLFRQAVQCRVEGEQVHVRLRRDQGFRVQVATLPAAAVSVRLLAAGVVNEDAPHRLGSGREEMTAVVPARFLPGADQAQV